MDAERKATLRKLYGCNTVVGELLDALDAAEARATKLATQIRGHCGLLTGHSEHADRTIDCLGEVHTKFCNLLAERDRLREVLERVEWSGWVNDEVGCSECDAIQKYDKRTKQWRGKHNRGCKVVVVLNRPECREPTDGS